MSSIGSMLLARGSLIPHEQVRVVVQQPGVYGLIHAELGLDANLLFRRSQPHPTEFDGFGFGYCLLYLDALACL